MTAPRKVYLQTCPRGSWVTPTVGKRRTRLEYTLSHATLLMLAASPANARLVDCVTGEVVATRNTVEIARARLRYGTPAPAAPAPRPLIRKKNPDGFAPVVIPPPKNHIGSWWAGTVAKNRTHITGAMLVATQDARFVPPKKRA
ncbi:hypothetical protein [Bradyrhizobium sp. DASA03007]|uniref:hypothetical protein n=1 Tax=unclassified Bradyrhizobium TaxID=2631580 RepID=UPI003F6E723E